MRWPFDNSFARELPELCAAVTFQPVRSPALLAVNDPLALELGLDADQLRGAESLGVLAGDVAPEGADPVAQAYGGHQFGHFSGMLGDGRAVLLGEVVDTHGRRRDIALKGSGRTSFSRGGDGRAAMGPVLREYLMGEAMHALGIPTTRALAAVATGEVVRRQPPQPGAVLTRVAASHLRIGTFDLVRAAGSRDHLRRLTSYAIRRHDPDLAQAFDEGGPGEATGAMEFLSRVVARQAELIAAWMSVGFIHGVMNTDNMTISGETIDYGPCAFMEGFDEDQVFSSIDTGGRYRYRAQPQIAVWNLSRLAETLLGLVIDEQTTDDQRQASIAEATERVNAFVEQYDAAWLRRFRAKLGLDDTCEGADGDRDLVADLLRLMGDDRLDFTLTFRRLAATLRGASETASPHVSDVNAWVAWEARWRTRLGPDTAAAADRMNLVNPLYVPRNHLVEEALAAAIDGDLAPFEALLEVVTSPCDECAPRARFAEPAPPSFTDSYVTYCGT